MIIVVRSSDSYGIAPKSGIDVVYRAARVEPRHNSVAICVLGGVTDFRRKHCDEAVAFSAALMMLKLYYFSLKKGTLCLALPRRHTDETVPLEQTLKLSVRSGASTTRKARHGESPS